MVENRGERRKSSKEGSSGKRRGDGKKARTEVGSEHQGALGGNGWGKGGRKGLDP